MKMEIWISTGSVNDNLYVEFEQPCDRGCFFHICHYQYFKKYELEMKYFKIGKSDI